MVLLTLVLLIIVVFAWMELRVRWAGERWMRDRFREYGL